MASAAFPDDTDIKEFVGNYLMELDPILSDPFWTALTELLKAERFALRLPDLAHLDLKQQMLLREELKKWELKGPESNGFLHDLITGIFFELGEMMPEVMAPSPFTVPFIYAMPNPREWISRLHKTLWFDKYEEHHLLTALRDRMYLNVCYVSGIEPYTKTTKSFKHAVDNDLPLDRLNEAYLKGTPFYDLFKAPVPLKMTHEDRFSHTHILAGSGVGKTVLIENLIRHDLASQERPTIVVIDPHSDLVRKLARSDLGCDPLIIDPRDTKYPVAMNPFAIPRDRIDQYDEATREQVTAGVIDTFNYLFSGMFDLTGKQGALFRPVVRFLLSFPETMGRDATIMDMLDFMTDTEPYLEGINQLPPRQRDFFMRDVVPPRCVYQNTKDEIRYRIEGVIENPTMARLFGAEERKVDFFAELNRPDGGVILIDTAADFLKSNSPLYGRVMISLLLQAIEERAAIEPGARKSTFVFIDEAGDFFDTNVDTLLNTARKFKAGMVLAHQYLQQANPELRASLASNTGIKFCSGVSAADAAAMAKEMRCAPDFILDQPRLQFAAHIRNVTPNAVSIPIPFVTGASQLSEEAYAGLIERNRARVSAGRQEPRKPRPSVEPSEAPTPPSTPPLSPGPDPDKLSTSY